MVGDREESASGNGLVGLTVQIVAAYAAKHAMPANALPNLIRTVHAALAQLAPRARSHANLTTVRPQPAVPVSKSVQHDFLVCLEDGKELKMLKRYLRTAYGMTPDDYRARWGLPSDYPMVAPAYAARRSTFAKQIGLGKNARKKP